MVRSGDLEDTAGSDIIVICFGPRAVGWERAAGAESNFAALKDAVPLLVASSPNTVFLIAANPVAAMTILVGGLRSYGRQFARILHLIDLSRRLGKSKFGIKMDIVQTLIETFPGGSEKMEAPRDLVVKQRSAVMRAIELPSNENAAEQASPFGPEATEVLQTLRISVASALSDIGDFSKPADVTKSFNWTVPWPVNCFALPQPLKRWATAG